MWDTATCAQKKNLATTVTRLDGSGNSHAFMIDLFQVGKLGGLRWLKFASIWIIIVFNKNLSLLYHYCFFSRGLKQMEVWVCFVGVPLF